MMISITNLEQLINGQFAKLPPCAGQAELGQRKLRILDLDDEDEGGDDGENMMMMVVLGKLGSMQTQIPQPWASALW